MTFKTGNILSASMAALLATLSSLRFSSDYQWKDFRRSSKHRRTTTKHPRNGKREVARRLCQIAARQLTRSNGLRSADELRWPA